MIAIFFRGGYILKSIHRFFRCPSPKSIKVLRSQVSFSKSSIGWTLKFLNIPFRDMGVYCSCCIQYMFQYDLLIPMIDRPFLQMRAMKGRVIGGFN